MRITNRMLTHNLRVTKSIAHYIWPTKKYYWNCLKYQFRNHSRLSSSWYHYVTWLWGFLPVQPHEQYWGQVWCLVLFRMLSVVEVRTQCKWDHDLDKSWLQDLALCTGLLSHQHMGVNSTNKSQESWLMQMLHKAWSQKESIGIK